MGYRRGPFRKVIMRERAPEVRVFHLEDDGSWSARPWRYPLIRDILECYHSTTRYSGNPNAVRRACEFCGPGCDCGVCRRQRGET